MAESAKSLQKKALAALRKADNFKNQGNLDEEARWRKEYDRLKALYQEADKKEKAAKEKKTTQSDLEEAEAALNAAKEKAAQGVPGATTVVKEKQKAVDDLKAKQTKQEETTGEDKAAGKPAPKPNVEIPTPSTDAIGPGKTPTKTSGKTPSKTPAKTKTPPADTKSTWVNYLREVFKNVGDPQAQTAINKLFADASKPGSGYTEATFLEALNQIPWWQAQQPSLQQWFIETHDPRMAGTLKERRANATAFVQGIMSKLGIQLNTFDPETNKVVDNTPVLNGLVDTFLSKGWDSSNPNSENLIGSYLAKNAPVHFTGGGLVGSSIEKIKAQGYLYGVNLDDKQLYEISSNLIDPNSGKDFQFYLNDIKNQAYNNINYRAFADIMQKNNSTLYDVTKSYREEMAKYLEVDPSAITWNDLMGKAVDSGTGNARTLSDFVGKVKQDPLWQKTANARQTYMGIANDLMTMFGITG